jgi:hypothetical protein
MIGANDGDDAFPGCQNEAGIVFICSDHGFGDERGERDGDGEEQNIFDHNLTALTRWPFMGSLAE